MVYSKYFSHINKEKGLSRLSSHEIGRVMNIIGLERSISLALKMKSTLENTDKHNYFDILIFKEQMLLTELTGNVKPDELILEMYRLSEN